MTTVKACIRCHGTWPATADAVSPTQPPVALALGVSCQACHGAGLRWNVAHYLPPHAWRAVTPEAKEALGFTDVRSPAKKAALCTSCHVGSVSEGKLVKTVDGTFPEFTETPPWQTVPLDCPKCDRIRVTLKTWHKSGGGFAEIEVQ